MIIEIEPAFLYCFFSYVFFSIYSLQVAIKPVFTFIIERKGRVQGRKTYDFLCWGDYRAHKRISPSPS